MVFHLRTIADPHSIITPMEYGLTFPETMGLMIKEYKEDIEFFKKLVLSSKSSAEILAKIRSLPMPAKRRMALLKIFRRCVCLLCDTENTKKIKKVSTEVLVKNYGSFFKPIEKLKKEFEQFSDAHLAALAMLIGEYDQRGQLGYMLTDQFFKWFEEHFPDLKIIGPRGAGKDIELSELFGDFSGSYPCDFAIKNSTGRILAVGFARYDSTRGGAQSDDRTGGNSYKVSKAMEYAAESGNYFKIIFVADGPGLTHKDTWEEACKLDGMWDDRVHVTTLKIAERKITKEWLVR